MERAQRVHETWLQVSPKQGGYFWQGGDLESSAAWEQSPPAGVRVGSITAEEVLGVAPVCEPPAAGH